MVGGGMYAVKKSSIPTELNLGCAGLHLSKLPWVYELA